MAMATVMIVKLIEGMMTMVVVIMALKTVTCPHMFFYHFIDPHIFAVHRFRPASPGVQTAVKQLVQRQELYIGQLERELSFCRFQS